MLSGVEFPIFLLLPSPLSSLPETNLELIWCFILSEIYYKGGELVFCNHYLLKNSL